MVDVDVKVDVGTLHKGDGSCTSNKMFSCHRVCNRDGEHTIAVQESCVYYVVSIEMRQCG